MAGENNVRAHWWGAFEIAEGARARWRIGPLELWIERLPSEWRISHEILSDPLDPTVEVECPTNLVSPVDIESVQRLATGGRTNRLRVLPALPDRPLVSRPEVSLRVLPRDEAGVFVSSPLWVQVTRGDAEAATLLDTPTSRPSDTWVGPSTRVGELCYASRTSARLRLENMPFRPNRAVSHVRLRNRASDAFLVQRLSVPAPELSLFVDHRGRLWTESITIERDPEGEATEVQIGRGPPSDFGPMETVCSPREPGRKAGFVGTISAFLGFKQGG